MALARAARGGDAIAMADLLDYLTPYVGRICGPIALSSGADATQETLIIVFKGLRSLREPEALHGWVRSIAVREAVRIARREPRWQADADPADLPAPGDVELAADIRDVLDRLTPEHRAALVLRDLEGLEEQEAAALMGLPVGTVKSRLHRARESFRKAWTR